jgi:hypothetical protein
MSANASVSFSVEVLGEYKPVVYVVTPVVNGAPLTQLIKSFEDGQQFEPAGGYGGLVPQFFDYGPLDRYLMGDCEPDSYWARLGSIYVLGCDCGEVGCWPLLCRVTLDSDAVVWDRFKQPHRPERDYSQFGPFVFDAAQYRTAVRALQVQFSEMLSTGRGERH